MDEVQVDGEAVFGTGNQVTIYKGDIDADKDITAG